MKKFNIKALFVNHGEKLGFTCVLLLVLGVLGTSEWFPYDKAPEEIIKKANDATEQIKRNVWPEETKQGFALRDFTQSTRELRGPLATSAYDYTTPLWHPLYRPQQLAKEPDFLAVIDLIAEAGDIVMAVAPPKTTETLPDESTTAGPAKPVAAADNPFAPAVATASPYGPAGAAAGAHGPGGTLPEGGMSPAMPMETAHGGGGGYGMPMGDGYGVGEYGMSALAPGVKGRGERFISVRGVWPVYQQLSRYRQAMNLQSITDARSLLELTDFVLERQTAVAASDPWSSEWQTIDTSRAIEMLSECPDFDIDIFDPRLVDSIITMPLPKRLTGRWGDLATHPQIENFKLKGPELEREMKFQEQLLREYERLNARAPKPVVRGGFSAVQQNFRGMSDSIYANPESSREFDRTMGRMMESDSSMNTTGARMTPADLKARMTAAERLFLFRYIDFDVRPGYAYRYRVKLVLRNPNFQRPLDQVIDKSVAEGTTRETPWSTESTVAVVPETTNYFIRNVFRDPLSETARYASRAIANLKIFQWDQTVGTMIADTIEIKSIGQFLGEKRKTFHLDVAKPSLLEEEVTFQTDDVYLDGLGDIRFSPDEHKDLKLPSERRGMLGLVAEALVLSDLGELKAITPETNADREAAAQQRVQNERQPFEKIKGKEPQALNPLDGGAYPGMLAGEGSYEMMMQQPGGATKKRGKAKPNPRKMMPGMMP